jgi:hypothetical protein
MDLNNFDLDESILFSEVNGLSEVSSETIEKWKNESKLENWSGFLVFKGLEGYYYVPFETSEEMKKNYSFYSAIDSFIGKIDV